MTTTMTTETTMQALEDICDDDDWEDAPHVRTSCRNCKKTFYKNKYVAAMFPRSLCDACSGASEALQPPKAYLPPNKEPEAVIGTVLPPAYRDNDVDRLPKKQLKRILQFNPNSKNSKGLYLVGPSRSGKTRSLSHLISHLIASYPQFLAQPPLFMPSGELNNKIIQSAKSNRNHKQTIKAIAATPILALDDLFNEHLTKSTEAALLEIFEFRQTHFLHTLITSQFTLPQAASKFSCPLRAHAITNRIKESTSLVTFNLSHKQINI